MPELAQLGSSGLPQINFQPINPASYINPGWVPDPLPPDLTKAYATQGKAAALQVAAKTIAELPDTFTKSYKTGIDLGKSRRDLQQQQEGQALKHEILAGGMSDDRKAALQGVTIGPDGSTTVKAPGLYDLELQKARLADTNAQVEFRKAQAEKARKFAAGGNMVANPLAQSYGGPDELPTDGVLGKVTSYAYGGDHYGGPNSPSSTTGPNGNKLDGNSMAVSPDIEKQLTARGYKLGDMVTLQTADGKTVTRRWDDRTAQWDDPVNPQFSVDDQGRKIIGENGKPLPALKGRFDFHAAGNSPSEHVDKQITGIIPRGGASTPEPSLFPGTSGGVVPASIPVAKPVPVALPVAPAAAAPAAPVAVPALSAMTFGTEESPGAGLLPPAPVAAAAPAAPAATPAAAPGAAPVAPVADANPILPDGTVDVDKISKVPGGGVHITDVGRLGGKVTRHGTGANMFYTEETADAIHIIPAFQKAGSPPQVFTKKKAKDSSSPDVDIIADAIINGDQPPVLTGLRDKTTAIRAALAKKGFDLSTATTDWMATSRNLASMNGPQQLRLRQAVDFTDHSLGLIEDLGKEWGKLPPVGGKIPLLNRATISAAKNGAMGQEAQSLATRFDAQINDLISEIAVVYKGGNSPTDQGLRLAAENLKSDFSPKTLQDSVDQIRKNLQIRANSLKNVTAAGTSGHNPYAPEGPAGGGPAVAPAAATPIPSAMVKMRAPDGSEQFVKPEAVDKYKSKGAVVVP